MGSELVRELINSGIHFGHRASRWNPKMKPYIFGKRNTIHIIDIRETVKGLLRAKRFIAKVVSSGEDVIFVGTKRQARIQIKEHATRVGMPWVTDRWLGGTLTNFRTIRSRLTRLEELEAAEADGSSQQYSKKMIAKRTREQRKILRNLQGIREMHRLPGAVIIVDVHRERNAVLEARKLGIPTICLIDTDSDPDFADIPIPGNDDAIRAIDTILKHLADAVEEGLRGRKAPPEQEGDDPTPTSPREAVEAAGSVAPGAQTETTGTDAGASSEPKPSDNAGVTAATASD